MFSHVWRGNHVHDKRLGLQKFANAPPQGLTRPRQAMLLSGPGGGGGGGEEQLELTDTLE